MIFFSIFSFMVTLGLTSDAQGGVWELEGGTKPGSVKFSRVDSNFELDDITGFQDGIYRYITVIDGKGALYAGNRSDYYFTLLADTKEPRLDCTYFDGRNKNSLARALAGMCGLNVVLDSEYVGVGQEISNMWMTGVYNFDTSKMIELARGGTFFLGKIGDISIFDKYSSLGALEAYAPRKYIQGASGCYQFHEEVVFLVYEKWSENPSYLDVLKQREPMRLQRMGQQQLEELAVGKCN